MKQRLAVKTVRIIWNFSIIVVGPKKEWFPLFLSNVIPRKFRFTSVCLPNVSDTRLPFVHNWKRGLWISHKNVSRPYPGRDLDQRILIESRNKRREHGK